MSIQIYVGNLSFESDEDELKELFEAFGAVESAKIISDQFTGRSRGFGFVEMAEREDAMKAIKELDSKELDGRNLKVHEGRPRIEPNTIHIIPRTGEWAVKREGAAAALRILPTKEEATDFANRLLEDESATTIVIHDKDGSVAARKTVESESNQRFSHQ